MSWSICLGHHQREDTHPYLPYFKYSGTVWTSDKPILRTHVWWANSLWHPLPTCSDFHIWWAVITSMTFYWGLSQEAWSKQCIQHGQAHFCMVGNRSDDTSGTIPHKWGRSSIFYHLQMSCNCPWNSNAPLSRCQWSFFVII